MGLGNKRELAHANLAPHCVLRELTPQLLLSPEKCSVMMFIAIMEEADVEGTDDDDGIRRLGRAIRFTSAHFLKSLFSCRLKSRF